MEIKTKYNIGDKFWLMSENKPKEFCVTDIWIHLYNVPCDNYQTHLIHNISYEDNNNPKRIMIKEEEFVPTKKDLLASL